MTESEAIKEVRFNMSTIGLSDKVTKRVVEARNRGNQPHEWKMLKSDNWHCSECDSFVGERVYVHDRHHDQRKKKYCDNCGQKLNWESDKKR